jgi:hypothetical protein
MSFSLLSHFFVFGLGLDITSTRSQYIRFGLLYFSSFIGFLCTESKRFIGMAWHGVFGMEWAGHFTRAYTLLASSHWCGHIWFYNITHDCYASQAWSLWKACISLAFAWMGIMGGWSFCVEIRTPSSGYGRGEGADTMACT